MVWAAILKVESWYAILNKIIFLWKQVLILYFFLSSVCYVHLSSSSLSHSAMGIKHLSCR